MDATKQPDTTTELSKTSKGNKYLILRIGSNAFGVLVDEVEDVLFPKEISPIPLSPEYILGSLNLRGRIVTAIDLGIKLGLEKVDINTHYRSIVIEKDGHLYNLLVDNVSEVIDIPQTSLSSVPENLTESWKKISSGVYIMENELMVILDIKKIIDNNKKGQDEDE